MNSAGYILILIGPPGSGKGTLSRKCVETLGWKQLSTGDLCRKHIRQQTEIGKEIDFAIKSGKLVSDALITTMVEQWIVGQGLNSTVILDGFPRTVPQALAFDQIFKAKLTSLKLRVIRLVISDEELICRLSSRAICKNKDCQKIYSRAMKSLQPKKMNICDACGDAVIKRADDNEQSFVERIKTYHLHENTLLNFYKNAGHHIEDFLATKPAQEVYDSFTKLVNN